MRPLRLLPFKRLFSSSVPRLTTEKAQQAVQTIERDRSVLLQVYARPDIIFTHGKGCVLYDTLGDAYLDLTAGIAVNALGHAHPDVLAAIHSQADRLIHISNLYHNEHAGEFARALIKPLSKQRTDRLRVFLCNSGTEANEGAIKFARKWGNTMNPNGEKHGIVSFNNAFHGRSMGALSATPTPKYQTPFMPMLPGFTYAPYNDLNVLDQVITPQTCGVLLEPIQGEGGVHVATAEFMHAVRRKCTETNTLMIVDEIQSGIGRSGKMFAHQWHSDIHPDMITVAKPLANGIPSGAVILSERVAEIIKPGDHGTTFGGGPLATAVGKAVLNVIDRPEFLQHVQSSGDFFKTQLQDIAQGSPLITDVRGQGLLLGIQFHEKVDPKLFVDLCRERRVLVVGAGCNTVRVIPPLIITREQIKAAIKTFEEVITVMESLIARGQDQ